MDKDIHRDINPKAKDNAEEISVSVNKADSKAPEDSANSGETITENIKGANVQQVDSKDQEISHNRNRILKVSKLRIAFVLPAIAIVLAGMVTIFMISERNAKVDNLLNVDCFYEGVYVDGISLGGLTMSEAEEKLKLQNSKRISDAGIVLTWDDEEIAFAGEDMDISFNTYETLNLAWNAGREGTEKERYDYVLGIAQTPVHYDSDMQIDATPLEAKVKAVALFKQRDPGEASVSFDPDPEKDGSEWFSYTEPQKGITTDFEKLWEDVVAELENKNLAVVEIPRHETESTTTIDDLKDMTQLIVQFKTHMVSDSNREHNVRLACEMINGTVLMPGEIFSMNETTGKRTKEAGFKEANVIVSGNRLEPGIAGGVCQVSGTLFNAAVRADLEIVERHHHSFELSYLTRGRDATVNYGTADLRFKNTSDSPIYISMYTIGRDVYAEIYGVPLADGMTIELYVKTTDTIAPGLDLYIADSSVPYGQTKVYSARTGIKCTTYKDYYDADGKLVDRVVLHRDYYRPFAKEIYYNPAAGKPLT